LAALLAMTERHVAQGEEQIARQCRVIDPLIPDWPIHIKMQ
jgi:hypothetical protein